MKESSSTPNPTNFTFLSFLEVRSEDYGGILILHTFNSQAAKCFKSVNSARKPQEGKR